MRFPSRLLLIAPVLVLLPVAALVWQARDVPEPRKPAPAVKPAVTVNPGVAVKPAAAVPAPTVPEPPKPLGKAPQVFKGVYLTSWSAGLKRRIDYVEDLSRRVGVNAVVIDIKDYSGYVAYRMSVPEVQKYGAVRVAVRDIDSVVRRLHAANVYVIARITVFQDPILAVARPDLAVHRKSLLKEGVGVSKDTLWRDRKGLAWIDPSSRAAWDYVAAIGHDALRHGFDELNFDYIRFPSDGDMRDMYFPASGEKAVKSAVIRSFFAYLRDRFPAAAISADLFGLSTVNPDDLGIGQIIEDAYRNFDYVCPMVYPSHYASGFRGFPNPAEHPYEVVKYSMEKAINRLHALQAPGDATAPAAPGQVATKLRPWLQDFNLGGRYDAPRIKAQIQATIEALGSDYAGYLMWSPSNVYTAAGLSEPAEMSAAGQPLPETDVR